MPEPGRGPIVDKTDTGGDYYMAAPPDSTGHRAIPTGGMAGAASTSGARELPADSLLLRRPHYELHGAVLP
jgi:hypothetical protein